MTTSFNCIYTEKLKRIISFATLNIISSEQWNTISQNSL